MSEKNAKIKEDLNKLDMNSKMFILYNLMEEYGKMCEEYGKAFEKMPKKFDRQLPFFKDRARRHVQFSAEVRYFLLMNETF